MSVTDYPVQIWEEASGDWRMTYFGTEYKFSSEQEAINAMNIADQQSASDEIINRVMGEMLPELETVFSKLKTIQEIWLVNNINDQIIAAAKNNVALSSYSPQTWAELGTAFTSTLLSLDTVIDSIGKSTKTVMLTRHQKAEISTQVTPLVGTAPSTELVPAEQTQLDPEFIKTVEAIFKTS